MDEYVDNKGNILLYIINDVRFVLCIFYYCDVDVNVINDKRFMVLMVVSKYGWYEMVWVLFVDLRVDILVKEIWGFMVVELVKDDDVCNKIDDFGFFSMLLGCDVWIMGVVRVFFVEDGLVRLVFKFVVLMNYESYIVMISRWLLMDFECLF